MMKNDKSTSWESVHKWYDATTAEEGHYYHRNLIFPAIAKTWSFSSNANGSVLDLGCGQGVFSRIIPPKFEYVGVDSAPSLIKLAKQYDRHPHHHFVVKDVTAPFELEQKFTHALFLLSLQNFKNPLGAIQNASRHLKDDGQLCIVLNHPCFRIPRQSSWEVDTKKKLQSRKIESYMSPMEIPINMHPGKKDDLHTYSYHWPLSDLSKWLTSTGFTIQLIEELCSDKKSTGAQAKMEDRARKEFPLFLVIFAKLAVFKTPSK